MRIRKGGTYRHISCLDVDMHVLAIKYIGERYFKLKVVWVNRHSPHILIEQPGQVKLMFSDLPKWKEV